MKLKKRGRDFRWGCYRFKLFEVNSSNYPSIKNLGTTGKQGTPLVSAASATVAGLPPDRS